MTGKPAPRDYVREWAEARARRLQSLRAMLSHRCTCVEPSEPDTGAPGVPACYQNPAIQFDADRCAECTKREPLFVETKRLRTIEKLAFRRLCRFVERKP